MLGTPAAGRLAPDVQAAAEEALAAHGVTCGPGELLTWGTAPVDALDAGSHPLNAADDRAPARRHATALADAGGFLLDHGDLPITGGQRPTRAGRSGWRIWSDAPAARSSTSVAVSPPPSCAGSPATPASCRSSSTARADPSTSASPADRARAPAPGRHRA